jgi:hypothetical protein
MYARSHLSTGTGFTSWQVWNPCLPFRAQLWQRGCRRLQPMISWNGGRKPLWKNNSTESFPTNCRLKSSLRKTPVRQCLKMTSRSTSTSCCVLGSILIGDRVPTCQAPDMLATGPPGLLGTKRQVYSGIPSSTFTATGWPFSCAGRNTHLLSACTMGSLTRTSGDCFTEMRPTLPSLSTTA